MDEQTVAALVDDDAELLEGALTLIVSAIASNLLHNRIATTASAFDLRAMPPGMSKHRFRSLPDDILRIHAKLPFPAVIYTQQRVPVSSLEALSILLARLAYPRHWVEVANWFGRSPAVLSSAFMVTFNMLHATIASKVQFDNDMIAALGEQCTLRVHDKAGCLGTCIAFVDGTVRSICRPTRHQQQANNGHKRVHAIKIQMDALANGLIVSLTGPIEGRRHDVALLRQSGLGGRMQASFPQFCLYGDLVYPVKRWLLRPYKSNALSREQLEFNRRVSSVRVAVEWIFGAIASQWGFLDFEEILKIGLFPIGMLYIIAGFLANCQFCARGTSQASFFIDIDLPTLDSYLDELHSE